MRKLLISIALFITFGSLFYIISTIFVGNYFPEYFTKSILYKKHKYGYTNTRLDDIKHYKKIDILIVGSSHTYRTFDPRVFDKAGYRIFALGTSAQSPLQTELLVKRYIKKLKPSLVVLEVYPVMFTIDGEESAVDILTNDVNDIYSLNMVMNGHSFFVFNTMMYSFYRNLMDSTVKIDEDWNFLGDSYITGGFVEKKLSYSTKEEYYDVSLSVLEVQKKAFKRTVDFLKEKGIPFVIVQTPITKNLFKHIKSTHFFDSTMSCFGEYRNFNHNSNFNDSLHFYDAEHLNQNGAEMFDNIFIEYLREFRFIK